MMKRLVNTYIWYMHFGAGVFFATELTAWGFCFFAVLLWYKILLPAPYFIPRPQIIAPKEALFMIKGVNKNIIEISDTGHDCFERAILFVRADRSGDNHTALSGPAHRYIAGLTAPACLTRKRHLPFVVMGLASALGGAGIATAFFLLL